MQEKEERQRKKAKVAARSKLSFMGEEEEEDENAAAAETIADGGAAKAEPPALPHHRRFAKLGMTRTSSALSGVLGGLFARSFKFYSVAPCQEFFFCGHLLRHSFERCCNRAAEQVRHRVGIFPRILLATACVCI